MIKSTAAWLQACVLIPNVLVQCGLSDGIKIAPVDRPSTLEIMFWELKVSELDAAKKPTYITWKSDQNNATEYSNGEALQRLVSGKIDIFSNNARTDSSMQILLQLIDSKFLENQWGIDITTYEYDEHSNRYHYSFDIYTFITG